MHYRMIVTMDKEKANDSKEARHFVQGWLDENGFCGQGRFASGMADWFVIGGRWSGDLSSVRLDKVKLKTCVEEFEKDFGWNTSAEDTEKQRREQFASMFNKYFPDYTGVIPFWRDKYNPIGEEDDAQIIDKVLYDNLIKELIAEEEYKHFCDIEEDEVDLSEEQLVGKKWAVVVDYHN